MWLFFLAAFLFFAHLAWGPAGWDMYVIENVRLPRALGALTTGVALSLTGLLLQTVFRNPLADPYVLGISTTAMLTSLAMYMLWRFVGLPYLGFFVGSLIGALGVTLLLLWVARRATLLVVLLLGVFLSFAAGAAINFLLLTLPPEELGYIYLALQGSFAAFPPGLGWAVAASVAILALVTAFVARWISAYIHGEEAAAGLGVNVKLVNLAVVAIASALTALAVASVGPVGFLGLAAPHIGRWIAGSHRLDRAMPHTVAVGVMLALGADLLMRLALPRDVPITALLSLVGVPVAVYYLWRYARGV